MALVMPASMADQNRPTTKTKKNTEEEAETEKEAEQTKNKSGMPSAFRRPGGGPKAFVDEKPRQRKLKKQIHTLRNSFQNSKKKKKLIASPSTSNSSEAFHLTKKIGTVP